MRPNPGDVIGGKYRIVRMIGDGGMGAVYEARHEVLGNHVALKFLHSELARRPGLASRFLQEARVSASIQSPHVTKVTDVDQTPDGSPYIVMELLTGESLQQLLDRQRKLGRDQALDTALQVLSGLEAAHALGVVHRDLKPDNVFITPSPGGPLVKLLDFGIAKLRLTNDYQKGLTRPGALMGTPEYMSPEQLYAADRVDHRADLYSLGVMLFEMLAGERPAYGEDASAIVGVMMAGKGRRIAELDPSIPTELAAVVQHAIDPDKGRRYQSALEMRMALAPFAGQLSHAGRLAATPIPAGASGPPPPVEPKASTPITADEPALQQPAPAVTPPSAAGRPAKISAVPPTLPPDDTAPVAPGGAAPTVGTPPTTMGQPAEDPTIKGGTQEASKELIQQLANANANVRAAPAPTGTVRQPAAPAAAAGYAQYGPPQRKTKKSGAGVVIGIVLGLATLAGIVAIVWWMRERRGDKPVEPIAIGTTAPTTTVTAQGGGDTTFNPQPQPPGPGPGPDPGPGPKPTGTGKPKPKDAGADGSAEDAGSGHGWPFPMPSGLPPLPSGLPPIPTGFPFPGFQPPPAGSN